MLNIVRRDPLFGDITRFDPFTNMDDLFKGFGMRPFLNEMEAGSLIKVDLSEDDKAYKIRAEIPGVNKNDIKIQVDGNRVSISAETKQEKEEKEGERVIRRECYQGSSYRSFSLDNDVDETNVQAKYENGMLELTLPKTNGREARRIEIK